MSARTESRLLQRLGVPTPIVQAGMGGGIAGAELAAAVSAAGGLGTIGFSEATWMRRELERARSLTPAPLAINLLLPFARRAHWELAREADVAVTFWGKPIRHNDGLWLHQAGSLEEVLTAIAAGADGVIAQGVEAGGHVRGTTPTLELVTALRRELGADTEIFAAGGIAGPSDVAAVLAAGADAAVSGTRFLLSDESGAHPEYKRRLLTADTTILTELFGAGWPRAPHRVVANAATDRWLVEGGRPARTVRALNALSGPLGRLPASLQARLATSQRAASPLLGPQPPVLGDSQQAADSRPLYAGECLNRIAELSAAGDLVRRLAAGA